MAFPKCKWTLVNQMLVNYSNHIKDVRYVNRILSKRFHMACAIQRIYVQPMKVSHNEWRSQPIVNQTLYNHCICMCVGSTTSPYITRRYKHSGRRKDDGELGEEEEFEQEIDAADIHFEDDKDFPPYYKDIEVHLSSPRVDTLVGRGLGLNRSTIEDCFYDRKLMVNGLVTTKKSKKLSPGDHIDVILDSSTETELKVKRVRLVQILDQTTKRGKLRAHIRVWRGAVAINKSSGPV